MSRIRLSALPPKETGRWLSFPEGGLRLADPCGTPCAPSLSRIGSAMPSSGPVGVRSLHAGLKRDEGETRVREWAVYYGKRMR
jgi:hypothetical protein